MHRTEEEQIFEGGQVTNVSFWDLASNEKGGYPGCLHGSQARDTHSLEWSRVRSRTSLEQARVDMSWLRSRRDASQECKGSVSAAQN